MDAWERNKQRRRAKVLAFRELTEAEQLDLIALHSVEQTRWDIFHDQMEALGMAEDLLRTMPGHGWPRNYVPYWTTL